MGCNNTITYRLSWSNIPDYCGPCQGKRKANFSGSTCPGTSVLGCGKLIWSPPGGKPFTLCSTCNAKKRADEDAKKRTKACPGLKGQGYCGKTISYRTDWDRIPDICPDCREKAKAEKSKRDEWKEKPCVTPTCNGVVKFKEHWDHKPNFCETCKEKQKEAKKNRNQKVGFREIDFTADEILPGTGQTARYFGGIFAKVRIYENGYQHVTVVLESGTRPSRVSWEVDENGNYIATTQHITEHK
jgi:hypothetical protein